MISLFFESSPAYWRSSFDSSPVRDCVLATSILFSSPIRANVRMRFLPFSERDANCFASFAFSSADFFIPSVEFITSSSSFASACDVMRRPITTDSTPTRPPADMVSVRAVVENIFAARSAILVASSMPLKAEDIVLMAVMSFAEITRSGPIVATTPAMTIITSFVPSDSPPNQETSCPTILSICEYAGRRAAPISADWFAISALRMRWLFASPSDVLAKSPCAVSVCSKMSA